MWGNFGENSLKGIWGRCGLLRRSGWSNMHDRGLFSQKTPQRSLIRKEAPLSKVSTWRGRMGGGGVTVEGFPERTLGF